MNKPNPLVPQGTFADKGKAQIRITVFAILGVHVVLLGVLLIAGCNKKEKEAGNPGDPGLPPPVVPLTNDTNAWPAPPPLGATSAPVVLAPPSNPPPPFTPEPIPQPATAATEHTIVKGDSFYTLGQHYKVGYKSIADANPGVDSTKLRIGQKIKIPPQKLSTTSAPTAGGGAPATGASGETTYTVKSGDNLTKIAKDHGVTPKRIQAANNLPTTKIRVGQKLKIPSKAPVALPEPVAPPPGIPSLPDGSAPPGLIPPTRF